MKYVFNEECKKIIRVGKKLMQQNNITNNNDQQRKVTSKIFLKANTNFDHQKYNADIMHGYCTRTLHKD